MSSETRTIENEEQFREYLRELGADPEDIDKGLEQVDEFLVDKVPDEEDLYPFNVDPDPVES